MTSDEIAKLIEAYGFKSEDAQKVRWLCDEVERTTRQTYFAFIQNANNIACSQEMTPRELDQAKYLVEKSRKEKGKNDGGTTSTKNNDAKGSSKGDAKADSQNQAATNDATGSAKGDGLGGRRRLK